MYKTTSVADLGYDSDIYDFFRTLDGEMETQTITPNNYWVSIDGTEATLFKTAPTGTPAESVYDDGTMVKANWNDLLEVLAPQSAGGTVAGASVDIADIPLTTGSTLQLNINSDIESTSLITGTIVRSSIDTAKASSVGSIAVMPFASWLEIASTVGFGLWPVIDPVSPRQRSMYSLPSTSIK